MDELVQQHNTTTEPTIADILYGYIDKFPEDAPKWVEYFKMKDADQVGRRRRTERNYDYSAIDEILRLMEFPSDINDRVTITPEIGCLHCTKYWVETPNMVTMNLVCGHKYHTVCALIYHHSHDTINCLVESCQSVNTWSLVNRIVHLRHRRNVDLEDVLTSNIIEDENFQMDFKIMKKHVARVKKTIAVYYKSTKDLRKKLIKKHLHSINYIQTDMNTAVKEQASGEESKHIRSAVSKYRKIAASIFRKYHVSFRDLVRKNMIKATWRVRHVLERHGSVFNNYRFGIRIYPGKKVWRDSDTNLDDDLNDD